MLIELFVWREMIDEHMQKIHSFKGCPILQNFKILSSEPQLNSGKISTLIEIY